jgi:predicted phage terminase large subunit-like protein
LARGGRQIYQRGSGDILQPSRDDRAVLDEMRATLGIVSFEAQYQQNPLPADGSIIKRSYLRYYDQLPEDFDHTIVSWDTALTLGEKADWSAGTVWGRKGQDFYLRDVIRVRLETPELGRRIEAVEAQYGADSTIVEKSSIGTALVQEMRRSSSIRPILVGVKTSKQDRMAAQSGKFEAGRVLLPQDAPWLGVYLKELLEFPTVDTTTRSTAPLRR